MRLVLKAPMNEPGKDPGEAMGRVLAGVQCLFQRALFPVVVRRGPQQYVSGRNGNASSRSASIAGGLAANQ